MGEFQDLGKTWVRVLAQDNVRTLDIYDSSAYVRESFKALVRSSGPLIGPVSDSQLAVVFRALVRDSVRAGFRASI